MSNDVIIPDNFGAAPAVLANEQGTNDDLGQGVAASYGIVGYKGKVWSIRAGGEEKILMRDDGDGPRNSIEVVLLKASAAVSKIYYKSGYVEGSNASPDCWSANGQVPDASVQNKVSPTCANCPMNAWGSRVTDAGKPAKACADSRRVAVVPVGDIRNEMFGGPMLLRVPAASLKGLKAYGEKLDAIQHKYFGVATRISFDPNEAYPHFVFSAIRPLNESEAKLALEMRADPKTGAVLSEEAPVPQQSAHTTPAPTADSVFEQPQPQPQPATTAAPPSQAATTGTPPAQPVTTSGNGGFGPMAETPEEKPAPQQAAPAQAAEAPAQAQEAEGNSPESFDDMLNSIL